MIFGAYFDSIARMHGRGVRNGTCEHVCILLLSSVQIDDVRGLGTGVLSEFCVRWAQPPSGLFFR